MLHFARYHLPAVLWAVLTLALLITPGGRLTWAPGLAAALGRAVHLTLFFVLLLLVARSFAEIGSLRRPLASAAGAALLYSVLTEALQIPVPGRSWELEDLVLDAAGVALGCGLRAARRDGG